MYSKDELNARIKIALKLTGKQQKDVLAAVGVGVNALNQVSDNKGIASFTLARIADEIGCSVDFLLGRSDEPMLVESRDSLFALLSSLTDSEHDDLRKYIQLLLAARQSQGQ